MNKDFPRLKIFETRYGKFVDCEMDSGTENYSVPGYGTRKDER
jgi:hypothetical protein